jgi:hypothetical protein
MKFDQKYELIINISDQHIPYHHPDLFEYLQALCKKWDFDPKNPKHCVVNGGDERDEHGLNFHGIDPDLFSHGLENEAAKKTMKPMFEMFPKMYLLESNHGSLSYRRAKFAGISKDVIKPYNEQIGAPKGWKWFHDLTLFASNDKPIYFCHGKTANILALSQSMGMSVVQFHFHEKFSIQYWANPLGINWALQSGCLIDDKSRAFAYNKINKNRPLIGTSIISDGYPVLEPMILNEKGRWTRELVG